MKGFVTLLLLILGSMIWAQNPPIDSHKKIDKLYARNQLNGAILVFQRGNCVLKRAKGVATPAGKDSLDMHSLFDLAEASAGLTAMAIAILQDRALLNWEDRMARFLPELPYQNIRIRDLLWHTSGLPDYFLLCEKYWEQQRPVNNHDLIDLLKTHEPRPQFLPGTDFEFSNTNYALLALIVERVSRTSFAAFLQREIFDPLEMHDAFAMSIARWESPASIPIAFRQNSKWRSSIYPVTYLDGVVGDKGIYLSPDDVQKWVEALLQGRLLSPSVQRSYWTAGTLMHGAQIPYAMGWFRSPDKAEVWHDGAWRGFRCSLMLKLEEKDGIVLLSNRNDRVVKLSKKIEKKGLP